MGNPFSEESTYLFALDSKQLMPECVTEAITTAKRKGESMYDEYVEKRLTKQTKAITDTIKRCSLPLFGTYEKTRSKKGTNQISELKNNCSLFAGLCIACQAREGNLDEFFKHENSVTPPALSQNGKMCTGQKSELIAYIEANSIKSHPSVDVIVLDAAAIVNMIAPAKYKTFREYAETMFLPHIIHQN